MVWQVTNNYVFTMSQYNYNNGLAGSLGRLVGAASSAGEAEMAKEAASKSLAITELLSISANLKAMHVKTGRYSQHMALDQAFDDLNESLDTFNECVQGYHVFKSGEKLPLKDVSVSFKLPGDDGVLAAVKELCNKFKGISAGLVEGQSPLVSVQDDVLNCFYQLFYRLSLKG